MRFIENGQHHSILHLLKIINMEGQRSNAGDDGETSERFGVPDSTIIGGCPFNGRRPLRGMKYPTRESPHRDVASPIKYNGLRMRPPL